MRARLRQNETTLSRLLNIAEKAEVWLETTMTAAELSIDIAENASMRRAREELQAALAERA
jgi:hypothetical protein